MWFTLARTMGSNVSGSTPIRSNIRRSDWEGMRLYARVACIRRSSAPDEMRKSLFTRKRLRT